MSDLFKVVDGVSMLPPFPQLGSHRVVTAVDTVVPAAISAGVISVGWDTVWLEAAFESVGTKTATMQILFWSPAAVVATDPVTGVVTYTGGWVEQDVLEDIIIIADNDGHVCTLLENLQRPFFVKVTALGSGAVLHLLVGGCARGD
jgi:hypothetical protein